jgi:hypothetical protein
MDLALDEAGASETPSSVIGFDVGRQQNISTGQRAICGYDPAQRTQTCQHSMSALTPIVEFWSVLEDFRNVPKGDLVRPDDDRTQRVRP